MAEYNTFLKLHRSILESAVFSDADALRLWIYLLCKASTQDRQSVVEGKVVKIKKGQIITGRKKLAEQLNMAESKVYRTLKLLEDLGNVNIKSNNRFSLVTIANWAKFQEGNSKVNNTRTTGEQLVNNRRTTGEQQTNTVEELKEYKKNYKNYKNDRMKTEEDLPFIQSLETQKIKPLSGEIGGGVVMLSDDQMERLMDILSQEEFDKYVSIVRECEMSGKSYKRKSHYQAILEMAQKDRRVK